MAYATQTDLGDRLTTKQLLELTDFDNAGVVVGARIDKALSVASGMLDSYSNGRYALPLAASSQVVNLTLDLAVYQLYANRQRAIPDPVIKAHDDAISFLKDVSAGKASLDQPAAPQVSAMGSVARDHTADPEVFDDNKLTGF